MTLHVRLHYDPDKASLWALSDGQIEVDYAETINQPGKTSVDVYLTQMLPITRYRIGVKEGDITAEIVYDGQFYSVNSDGTLDSWGNIPDYHMDYLLKLID